MTDFSLAKKPNVNGSETNEQVLWGGFLHFSSLLHHKKKKNPAAGKGRGQKARRVVKTKIQSHSFLRL
jgi:hypothetical protein